jgi:uncharacterized membrane protein YcaP (DUF421 family)
MELIGNIFGSGQSLTLWQECARAILIFAYGLVLLRLTGRRTFGKWSALDIVVSIIVGSALARTMTGGAPLGGTLAAVAVFMTIHMVLAHACARSEWWSQLVEGTPVTLASDGRTSKPLLKAHAVSQTDLAEALRLAGLADVAAARLVTLEPSGRSAS